MKMSPPTVVVEQKAARRPGRPRLTAPDVEPASVHLKLPPEDYDAIDQITRTTRRGRTIQDVIRLALRRFIEDERGMLLRNKKT